MRPNPLQTWTRSLMPLASAATFSHLFSTCARFWIDAGVCDLATVWAGAGLAARMTNTANGLQMWHFRLGMTLILLTPVMRETRRKRLTSCENAWQ